MKHWYYSIICTLLFTACNTAESRTVTFIAMHGSHAAGTLVFSARGESLVLSGKFSGLSKGQYRIDIHENASCENNGEGAGPHYDPIHTEELTEHFLGRLPSINVDENGKAEMNAIIDQLSITDGTHLIVDRSVVIHAPDKERTIVGCGIIR